MTEFTDCAHNMLRTLTPQAWLADLAQSGIADLVGYCEAGGGKQRATLADYCKRSGRGLHHPRGSSLALSYDPQVFAPVRGERGRLHVHDRHPSAKFNPARDVVWMGFVHRRSSARVLRIDVHATAGALKPEDETPWGEELNVWKNWAVRQYWLAVVGLTARQLARETWDAVLLGGDFNGRLENDREWYYPGPLLAGLYVPDAAPDSIDRLVHTASSTVKQRRRWSTRKRVNSDHALHFARYGPC